MKGRKDIVGAAETGSGKTLAFGIPIIYGIMKDKEFEQKKLKQSQNEEADDGASDNESESSNPEQNTDDEQDTSEDEEHLDGNERVIDVVDMKNQAPKNVKRRTKLRALIVTPTRC